MAMSGQMSATPEDVSRDRQHPLLSLCSMSRNVQGKSSCELLLPICGCLMQSCESKRHLYQVWVRHCITCVCPRFPSLQTKVLRQKIVKTNDCRYFQDKFMSMHGPKPSICGKIYYTKSYHAFCNIYITTWTEQYLRQ